MEIGPIRQSFHEAPIGQSLAMIGSTGYLEIAVNQGRTADRHGDWSKAVIRVE
jgi:S-adenosylmethionine hydrolase